MCDEKPKDVLGQQMKIQQSYRIESLPPTLMRYQLLECEVHNNLP